MDHPNDLSCAEETLLELRKTNALLETIGAMLLHQLENQETVEPVYSILELRKSLIAAGNK